MTNKEIAGEIEAAIAYGGFSGPDIPRLRRLVKRLDLPSPEPGELVWCRDREGLSDWALGLVEHGGKISFFGSGKTLDLRFLQWKSAPLLQPGQVALDVENPAFWPGIADRLVIEQRYYGPDQCPPPSAKIITREEAEELHREP